MSGTSGVRQENSVDATTRRHSYRRASPGSQGQHGHPRHHAHHGHRGHHHGPSNLNRIFALGVALNLGFTAIEAIYGWRVGSLALLADALHNLSDVAALLLAWAAVWAGGLAASPRHTYGFRRASIVAAFVNATLLLVAMGFLVWEALDRLSSPAPIDGWVVVAVAGIGVVVNGVTAGLFMRGSGDDLNLRGAFLHMAADALVSLGVVGAGLLYLRYGWELLDPLVSLAIALVIIGGTWQLFRDSLHLLFDGVPEGTDLRAIEGWLREQPGVADLHDLHVWAMSTTEVALTAHLIMPGGHPGDAVLQELSAELHSRFGIDHPTLQIEQRSAAESGCTGCWPAVPSADRESSAAGPANAIDESWGLVGDVGGTYARFALVAPSGELRHQRKLALESFSSFAEAMADFLATGDGAHPLRAVLAVAAPVKDPHAPIRLTNADFDISPAELGEQFGFRELRLVNDFAALAHAIPVLQADEWVRLSGGEGDPNAPQIVLGPGTGLGVAIRLPDGSVLAGEGGHVTLAPADEREARIIDLARREWPHVSAERLVSGTGLPLLYRCVGAIDGLPVQAEWVSAREIFDAARRGDAAGVAAVECFFAMLATVAGNLALSVGAKGGVFLGGGIPAQQLELLRRSAFASRFISKGRFSADLADIPVYVILSPTPALAGAARLLAMQAATPEKKN